jgi:hypothetical protein
VAAFYIGGEQIEAENKIFFEGSTDQTGWTVNDISYVFPCAGYAVMALWLLE